MKSGIQVRRRLPLLDRADWFLFFSVAAANAAEYYSLEAGIF
jgi:hypothetical protein